MIKYLILYLKPFLLSNFEVLFLINSWIHFKTRWKGVGSRDLLVDKLVPFFAKICQKKGVKGQESRQSILLQNV